MKNTFKFDIGVVLVLAILLGANSLFAQSDTINQLDNLNRKQGYWIKYQENGKPLYDGIFKDNAPVGKLKRYRSDGSVKVEMDYPLSADLPIRVKFFATSGKPFAEGYYRDKQRDSIWNYYSENGNLRYQESYSKGVRNGSFKQFYPNGQLMETAIWVNGRLNGKLIQYFSNGLNRSVMNYSMGVINGDTKVYYPNGKIRISGFYADGLKQNEWTYYTQEGEIIDVIIYEKGDPQNKSDMIEQANQEFLELLNNAGKIKEPDINDIVGDYY